MLVGQAATAFALFFGAAAPRQHDETLRERLLA
jgi:shikimate dehydrogenase